MNNPPEFIYIAVESTNEGVEHIEWEQTGPASGSVKAVFHEPGSLANGTYADTITVTLCYDNQCREKIDGTPKDIAASYVVSGEGTATATLSRDSIETTGDQRQNRDVREDLTASIAGIPAAGLKLVTGYTSNAVKFVSEGAVAAQTSMTVGFRPPSELDIGTYADTVTVRICYAENCVRQVPGSPFVIPTTYRITLGVEPGFEELPFISRMPLGHDVIDAAYSAPLNAIVMVSQYPSNALYIHDIDDGTERRQPLPIPATSLEVSPDGMTAAVGHDAFVSIVDLANAGMPGAPPPTALHTSIPVHDLAIDGAGHVFAVTSSEFSDDIHAIDIATDTEQRVEAYVEQVRIQPGSTFLYALPDAPPSPIKKWDVSTGVPSYLYAWPYHAMPQTCERFWFNEAGTRIYGACGDVFAADAVPEQDFAHLGTLTLTDPVSRDENQIRSLSHSGAEDEVALIEAHSFDCDIGPLYQPCYTRFATYDGTTLARTSIYGIGPVTDGGIAYAQRGKFVFHDGASARKLLIGELEDQPDEDRRYWITIVE